MSIGENIKHVVELKNQAAEKSGRSGDDVLLVAVTKLHTVEENNEAIDCGITVATIMKFNERLKRMNEIAQRIHHLSDEVGENIYENVTEALEKKEKFEEEHEEQIVKIAEKKENIRLGAEVRKIEGRMEIERLKEQYRNMLEEKINGHNRLMKAFPKMTSDNHNETLQRLKTYIEKRGKSDDKRS